MHRQPEVGVRRSSYVGRQSDQLFFVDTRGDGFDDVRVRVCYFGGDSGKVLFLRQVQTFMMPEMDEYLVPLMEDK